MTANSKNPRTVRLLYPDFLGGGLSTYWLGARLMAFTIAEYLPFEAERLAKMFAKVPLFTEEQ